MTVTADQETGLETATYVYAIVDADGDRVPGGLTGLDDSPVELVERDGVAAAVATIALERPPGRRADLMAHSAVLEALASTGPVVPVQFGSIVRDHDSVHDEVVGPDVGHWTSLLDALRNRSQLNLRVKYHEEVVLQEIVTADPEIAELRARTRDADEIASHGDRVRLGQLVARAVEAKRAVDSETVLGMVLPYVVSYNVHERGGLDHVLDVALLVDDDRREELEDTLEQLAEGMHERMRFQLLGPTPPYDFVDGDWWA